MMALWLLFDSIFPQFTSIRQAVISLGVSVKISQYVVSGRFSRQFSPCRFIADDFDAAGRLRLTPTETLTTEGTDQQTA
ncbi:hypothetical protein M5J15_04210 [Serratia symbiotica]|uniref:hypothetical protein n=1 Tax=Serratia symbiotica TaxID=138074 RepID=UPI00209116E9|nr:hypothetical protein [Serratia symbiotica]USS96262.1 hypothetical protein M5J15_04210 [Serratia symbiotica]